MAVMKSIRNNKCTTTYTNILLTIQRKLNVRYLHWILLPAINISKHTNGVKMWLNKESLLTRRLDMWTLSFSNSFLLGLQLITGILTFTLTYMSNLYWHFLRVYRNWMTHACYIHLHALFKFVNVHQNKNQVHELCKKNYCIIITDVVVKNNSFHITYVTICNSQSLEKWTSVRNCNDDLLKFSFKVKSVWQSLKLENDFFVALIVFPVFINLMTKNMNRVK